MASNNATFHSMDYIISWFIRKLCFWKFPFNKYLCIPTGSLVGHIQRKHLKQGFNRFVLSNYTLDEHWSEATMAKLLCIAKLQILTARRRVQMNLIHSLRSPAKVWLNSRNVITALSRSDAPQDALSDHPKVSELMTKNSTLTSLLPDVDCCRRWKTYYKLP